MVSYGTRWLTGIGVRQFVRIAAVLIGLANLAALPLWFHYPFTLTGEEPLVLALVPVLAAVVAGLAASEVVLRVFELPGRSFSYRYLIAVGSVCLGGIVLGAPLGMMFGVDGTFGADPSPAFYGDSKALLGALASAWPAGPWGAAFGLAVGLAEGLVLAFPLAAVLGDTD